MGEGEPQKKEPLIISLLQYGFPVAGSLLVLSLLLSFLTWTGKNSYFPMQYPEGDWPDPALELHCFDGKEYQDPVSEYSLAELSGLTGLNGVPVPVLGTADSLESLRLSDGLPDRSPEQHGISEKLHSIYSSDLIKVDLKDNVKRVVLSKGETLFRALSSLSLDRRDISMVGKALGREMDLRSLRPGDTIVVMITDNGHIGALSYESGPLKKFTVVRGDDGTFSSVPQLVQVEVRTRKVEGTVTGDLYSSFEKVGLTHRLAANFAEIFSSSMDFNTDLHLGDSFSLIFQELWDGPKRIGYGKILAAAYHSVTGKTDVALYFRDEKQGIHGYFTKDGTPVGSYFLRSPLKTYRITSRFTSRRFHPILKVYRPHYGVDLSAPTGTPVQAVADGVVSFLGWQRGYGRTVAITHPGGYKTFYAHLSRFAKGLKRGKRVHQKQVIGFVGRSGYATGPHLDYRIQKNGRWINPLGPKIKTASRLDRSLLKKFQEETVPILSVLEDSGGTRLLAVEEQSIDDIPMGSS